MNLIFFLIPIIILLAITVQSINAFDYISASQGGIWNHTPKICINPPDEQKWYTLKALSSWRDVWFDYTGNHGLDFKIATIHPKPQLNCDVELVNGNPAGLGADKDALGATSCQRDKKGFNTHCLMVMFFDRYDWYTTVQHETGHSLGLGHLLAFNQTGFAGVVLSNDMMFPSSQLYPRITQNDINALKSYYGNDGFANPPLNYTSKNYTINHQK